jgi:hypothetical protein
MLSLLLACHGSPDPGPGPEETGTTPTETFDDTGTPPPPPPVYEVNIAIGEGPGGTVIDPKLAPNPLTFAFTHVDPGLAQVTIEDETGAAIRTLADGSGWVDTVEWDGLDETGVAAVPGRYTVHLVQLSEEVAVAEATLPVDVVRVGATSGTLGGEDRIPLTWHYAGGAGMFWDGGVDQPTFLLDSIDDAKTGEPAVLPIPWEDLYTPPDAPLGQNMPAAFTWDARPTFSLSLGGASGQAVMGFEIDGWTLTKGTVAAGETVTFEKDEPLSDSVGVWEPTLTLRWTDPSKKGAVVGTVDVPLRVYLVLGAAMFPTDETEHQAWVAAIDPALRDIAGTEPTSEAVASALVDWIYYDLGLAYDIQYGASAYTNYQGSFTDPVFPMTAFLDRKFGDIVNCSDCAGILNAYANMLGVDLSYAHIFSNFDLNYIQAIGFEDYTHCPFGGGGCGFSYHAVTTLDAAATIWDATLALDGDKDPSSEPSTLLMVQAIEGAEYLWRLSPESTYYDKIDHGTLR